jgi:hypothetical protein
MPRSLPIRDANTRKSHRPENLSPLLSIPPFIGLGRFRVDFHHWQPRHAQALVFNFTLCDGRPGSSVSNEFA